jgi:hypothetical protein
MLPTNTFLQQNIDVSIAMHKYSRNYFFRYAWHWWVSNMGSATAMTVLNSHRMKEKQQLMP